MRKLLCYVIIALSMVACSTDDYESGDGNYSYLRADFVDAHTGSNCQLDYAVTDGGDTLRITPQMSFSWAVKNNSMYRALLYYNAVADEAKFVNITQVPVLFPINTNRPDTLSSDPITFESAWVSANKKYLNIGFYVKTGSANNADVNAQLIGLACDSIVMSANGKPDVYLRFVHYQNGVPQYYSSHQYISVLLQSFPQGHTIHLSVKSYDGWVKKDF